MKVIQEYGVKKILLASILGICALILSVLAKKEMIGRQTLSIPEGEQGKSTWSVVQEAKGNDVEICAVNCSSSSL